ncbi:hypothetical protein N7478_005384 [Penicillium angulare]|uniref:uncharacterized protein n=1 Tax=Penicillium angulare TaxID=116970 RepID=UPI002542657B|nr:uncharacterized protein N7478_005384 [Penicillium angulare]KAJ5280012.1 hypothetical protein N7478_005384 [Penicillium angulare]
MSSSHQRTYKWLTNKPEGSRIATPHHRVVPLRPGNLYGENQTDGHPTHLVTVHEEHCVGSLSPLTQGIRNFEIVETESPVTPKPSTPAWGFHDYTPSLSKKIDTILRHRPISVVECHAEGEACDVVIGGMESVTGSSAYRKQLNFKNEHDPDVRMLLNEPRGRNGKNAVFLLHPTGKADRCLVFAKNDEYVPFSISSMICAANVLAEFPQAGGPPPELPCQRYIFETVAGRVAVEANYIETKHYQARCDSVTVYGVPSFVLEAGYKLKVTGLGVITVDIVYGGVFCAFVDVESVDLAVHESNANQMVEIGEQIRKALLECDLDISHPRDYFIRGISNVVFTEAVEVDGEEKSGISATVVSPGRLDRSPSGTSLSAWLALLSHRGGIDCKDLRSYSISGSQMVGRIRGGLKVGKYDAIYPCIEGRAWVTSFKQVVLDPTDPYPMGFRGADQWGPKKQQEFEVGGLGIHIGSLSEHGSVDSDREKVIKQIGWKGANSDVGGNY